MTKKMKLLSLMGVAFIITTPITIIACQPSEIKIKPELQLLNKKNQNIAIDNIKETVKQVVSIYERLLIEAKATESQISDQSIKNGLVTYLNELSVVQTKLSTGGEVRLRIDALDYNADDYKNKLDEIIIDLKDLYADILVAYKTYAKILEPTIKENEMKYTVNEYNLIKERWGDISPELDSLTELNLARFVESLNQLPEEKIITLEQDQVKLSKYLAQVFNLLTKRELQTIAIARIIEENNVSDEKISTKMRYYYDKFEERIFDARMDETLLTKIDSLEAKFNDVQEGFIKIQTAQNVTNILLTNAEEKHLSDAQAKLTSAKKSYNGFEIDTKTGSVILGIQKLIASLNYNLRYLIIPSDSVSEFNNFFQNVWSTSSNSALLYFNTKNAYTDLKQLQKHLNDYKAVVSSKKTTTTTNVEAYDNLEKIINTLDPIVDSLVTNFKYLASLKELSARKLSLWVVNQNIRSFSSIAELILVSIAIDDLTNINAKDVAL